MSRTSPGGGGAEKEEEELEILRRRPSTAALPKLRLGLPSSSFPSFSLLFSGMRSREAGDETEESLDSVELKTLSFSGLVKERNRMLKFEEERAARVIRFFSFFFYSRSHFSLRASLSVPCSPFFPRLRESERERAPLLIYAKALLKKKGEA